MAGSTFISQYRDATSALLADLDRLRNLYLEYEARRFGETLREEDFAQGHADLTPDAFRAAVKDVEEIMDFLGEKGYLVNLYPLKR